MSNYLYGSSIQGIQKFIFDTNKLVEIVGASELVEQLSKEKFLTIFNIDEHDLIMNAAGNIRLITSNVQQLNEIVLKWPKKVSEIAPGLILSQAIVEVNGTLKKEHFDELEKKLRIARNWQPVNQLVTPMGAMRSQRTGRVAIDRGDENNAPRDLASFKKQEAGKKDAPQKLMQKCLAQYSKEMEKKYPYDISDILSENQKTGWLAVVHADGNNLGKLIQSMVKSLERQQKVIKNVFREFSEALNEATITAVKQAIEKVVQNTLTENKKLPFRPVVVGGDDFTLIIRADLALPFTKYYLEFFRQETAKYFKKLVDNYSLDQLDGGITACAGIAYMKESFPFHYAADLAEALCAEAKREAKKIDESRVPSALLFHKIQDSFVEDYHDIIKRELTTPDGISFKYGPYSVTSSENNLPSLQTLLNQVSLIIESDSPKSGIRKWLSLLHRDKEKANIWLDRVKQITAQKFSHGLKLDIAIKDSKTHLYDVLTIASISKIYQ